MSHFVGIDGGGTRTTAVVLSADGAILARAQGPAGRVDVRDPAAGAEILASLTRDALDQVGAQTPVAALCCALAGAGRAPERRALEQALQGHRIASTIIVVGDAEAALQDAFASGSGILLISGTGSVGWGRGDDGKLARCGGWGHLLGDEGSGYAIGQAALRAAVRTHDGRQGETGLLPLVLSATRASDPSELIGWTASASKADIAALAPEVIDLAAIDPTAAGIVEEAARELSEHFAALYERLRPWGQPARVALTGGLLALGRPLRPYVEAAIAEWELDAHILQQEVDAGHGAALLALLAVTD